jgi:hypothetical protein
MSGNEFQAVTAVTACRVLGHCINSEQEAKTCDAQLRLYQKGSELFDVPL